MSYSFHIFLFPAGPLCLGKHGHYKDRRLDDTFTSFKRFNRTLEWTCETGAPAILEITPNSSWPDIVYYNSFTHANMGWKIHIIDNGNSKIITNSSNSVNIKNTENILSLFICLIFIYINV